MMAIFLSRELAYAGVVRGPSYFGIPLFLAGSATTVAALVVQIVAPTDMVLLLTYQISMTADVRVDGSFSVCYPFPTLEPTMGNLERKLWADPTMRPQTDTSRPFTGVVPELTTPITVRLSDAMMPAEEIAALEPGNVLRLTHRVDEPAIVEVLWRMYKRLRDRAAEGGSDESS